MKHLAKLSASRTQSGFTLVEVLVTLVILSTGMLGVAQMQVNALRGNQSAYLGSLAAQQAQDMAERMKANPAGVAADHYDALAAGVPGLQVDCESAACTPDQVALFDHNRWNAANQRLLPGGAGTVSEVGDGMFMVAVRWQDKQLNDAAGWQAGTTTETACGAPQAGVRCFFLRYQV